MRVNIFDVAKKSGLSIVTVSRVLNNAPTVRENNRKKVLEAIKELNYSPNSAARTLVRGKTGVIGLTLTALNDSVFDGVVKSVFEHLKAKGYFLAISIETKRSEDSLEPCNFLFQEDRVDGIIVLSALEEDAYVAELERKHIPFVMIDSHGDYPEVTTVNVDNYLGGYEATQHLIGLGHTRIAHISGQDWFLSARQRKEGFIAAMTEAGLSPSLIAEGTFGIHCGYGIMQDWIAKGQVPSAIFAADDVIALGVIRALMEAGYNVPHDVSVIGYDDQTFAKEVHPMLTTIRQPVEQMGAHAVNMILDMVQGKPNEHIKMQLKPELIFRESTSKYKGVVDKR
ncbi:LacI family transcriptional regulator [Paenibacillus shirakamiensis]|uniref:LacI family transcriptional regulator n=1 Tax=Paenibacillus shirakamiensis TaxID=1265935 RepID=A0ABS4JER2_9BACL|nr:LacI family DNA-binding transcriptional regulator [Paenibacillus shirakamiensis]MBP2000196.1 LacI family transcriptional regulator [Paenibacillus shirakamiensis]